MDAKKYKIKAVYTYMGRHILSGTLSWWYEGWGTSLRINQLYKACRGWWVYRGVVWCLVSRNSHAPWRVIEWLTWHARLLAWWSRHLVGHWCHDNILLHLPYLQSKRNLTNEIKHSMLKTGPRQQRGPILGFSRPTLPHKSCRQVYKL